MLKMSVKAAQETDNGPKTSLSPRTNLNCLFLVNERCEQVPGWLQNVSKTPVYQFTPENSKQAVLLPIARFKKAEHKPQNTLPFPATGPSTVADPNYYLQFKAKTIVDPVPRHASGTASRARFVEDLLHHKAERMDASTEILLPAIETSTFPSSTDPNKYVTRRKKGRPFTDDYEDDSEEVAFLPAADIGFLPCLEYPYKYIGKKKKPIIIPPKAEEDEMMLPQREMLYLASAETPFKYMPRRKKVGPLYRPQPLTHPGLSQASSCTDISSVHGPKHQPMRCNYPRKDMLHVQGFDGGADLDKHRFTNQLQPFMIAKVEENMAERQAAQKKEKPMAHGLLSSSANVDFERRHFTPNI